MSIIVVLLIVLLLFGGGYGYNAGWHSSPYGMGGLGLGGIIVLVLVVLLFTGRL